MINGIAAMRLIVTGSADQDPRELLGGDSHRPDRPWGAHRLGRAAVYRPADCAGIANPDRNQVASAQLLVFAWLHDAIDGASPVDRSRHPRGCSHVELD